jgi:Fe-S-cluster containining protein
VSPCQACGACCATYRVSFHSDEVDDSPGGRVPAGLVEPVSSQVVCMRGTASAPSRCIALRGTIGEDVSCAIYEFRPSACREFAPLAAVGRGDEACNDARRRHHLPALSPVAA